MNTNPASVIQIFTADGSGPPSIDASVGAGSFGRHREALTLGGEHDGLPGVPGTTAYAEAMWRTIDNVTDRRYAGSVSVDESKGRFFEPAPGRNDFAGIDANYAF